MDWSVERRPGDQEPVGPERLLTSSEVARILAVSERTLWKLTKSGDVPCVQIGRSVRYDARSLDRGSGRERHRAARRQVAHHGGEWMASISRTQRPSDIRFVRRAAPAEDPAGQGDPETGRGG
ncbi:MAG: hypothetical protein CM1200mP2_42930 [Planctomycetaceae bacterium]|nr:MAG: hypothetical protein CM1200mP2_42930 [Planctomycetaceae bacterium]